MHTQLYKQTWWNKKQPRDLQFVAQQIWVFSQKYQLTLTGEHIQSKFNVEVDFLSRH